MLHRGKSTQRVSITSHAGDIMIRIADFAWPGLVAPLWISMP
jgi:hypothetical protein